ncbi:MAG TPA: glycerol-3-phosphate 1-O-acyltransferase PlsY [Candidatus Kapabacteria bacterium]|nr:glycerol-3-phosphate 1-O-acyltransferase PlsY [Candidatus Kapabacteria bacterium]
MEILLIVLVAYLIGSIPSAVIISKLFYGFDIREKGSGNMGSTNTFRVLGWKAGLVVQILDVMKGVAAVIVAVKIFDGVLPFPNATGFEDITIVKTIAGIAAVLGHIFTAFAGFRGGKGINTALGMLIGIAPVELAVAVGVFLLVVVASGYVSLGSIIAAVTLPTTMVVRYNIFHVQIEGYNTLILFCAGLAALIIYTHRSNIRRLFEGRENRFNKLRIFHR